MTTTMEIDDHDCWNDSHEDEGDRYDYEDDSQNYEAGRHEGAAADILSA